MYIERLLIFQTINEIQKQNVKNAIDKLIIRNIFYLKIADNNKYNNYSYYKFG